MNGTHQVLAYADDVNLIGDDIRTIERNAGFRNYLAQYLFGYYGCELKVLEAVSCCKLSESCCESFMRRNCFSHAGILFQYVWCYQL